MPAATELSAPMMNLSGEHLTRRNRRKLLVVSNCQTFGVVNCMHNITSGVEVDGKIVYEVAGKSPAFYADLLDRYEHVFTVGHLREQVENPAYRDKMSYLPTIHFDAYHPDMIYVRYRDRSLDSPLGGYHSALALAGFQRGLSEIETADLFTGATYRALGYYDGWDAAKAMMLQGFRSCGLGALENHFYRWCAQGAFMLSINHPRIRTLNSIAVEALRSIGIPTVTDQAEIADNMLNGPIFPVYPEIGEQFGVPGNYRFKPPGTNYTLDLQEFLALTFQGYQQLDMAALSLESPYRDKVDAVLRLLR